MKESPSQTTTRREFCSQACCGAALAAAGVLMSACSGSNPTSPSGGPAPTLPSVSGSVSGRTVSVTVSGSSALASVGSAALVQTSLGAFLMARVAQDSFTALTATCTHEAQIVTGFSDGHYVCNVHGSEFSTSGAVVAGPARSALRQYTTSVSGDVVSFTV
jgi:cytochrome b6-f complex iron-sulfur subunit